jgi:hypothetical protein
MLIKDRWKKIKIKNGWWMVHTISVWNSCHNNIFVLDTLYKRILKKCGVRLHVQFYGYKKLKY